MFKERYTKYIRFLDVIDLKYLGTKMAIWVFSAIISLSPIAFDTIIEFSKQDNIILSLSTIYNYILSSTNTVYSLVTLLAMALADALCGVFMDGKESKAWTFIYCLIHISTIVIGVLLYASCKIVKVGFDNMKRTNQVCFSFVFIISLLSYVNISISTKKREKTIHE